MTSIIERSGLLGNFVFNKQTNFLNRIGRREGEREREVELEKKKGEERRS